MKVVAAAVVRRHFDPIRRRGGLSPISTNHAVAIPLRGADNPSVVIRKFFLRLGCGSAPYFPRSLQIAHAGWRVGSRIVQLVMNGKIPSDQLRTYIESLTSQARASLLVEIERKLLYGEDVPGSDIMLAELRAEFRKSGQSSDRAGNPSRYFFKPIEALFVDRPPELAHSGQISRGSLSAIWEWINQSLLPAMAADYCETMKRAIVANNAHEARQIAAGFQNKVIKSLEAMLSSRQGLESVRSGLGKYTSSRASLDDLKKIMSALRVSDAIVAIGEALPSTIENLEGDTLAHVRDLLDIFVAKHPEQVPFALTIVATRLKTPWQLIRLAAEAAHGRNAGDIEPTRYAISISMVLDHLDHRRTALNRALKSNRVLIAKGVLADIYDIEHGLRGISQLDESDWGRRLDELMTAIAGDLQTEFQTLPEHTHHILASRTFHRGQSPPGLVTYLACKSRDALVGGAAYCRNLVGRGHRSAG